MSAHGTRSSYVGGCRCDKCRRANADYQRDRQRTEARVRYGIEEPRPPAHVDATEAREHLHWLRSQGIGRRTVAERTGLAPSNVREIAIGRRQRITPATADRILAVGKHNQPEGARVDAAETWRLVDELLDRGFTKVALGRYVHGPQARSLQLGRTSVLQATATKIAELHRRTFAVELLRDEARREHLRNARAKYRQIERTRNVA